MSLDPQLQERIDNQVKGARVVLYMKGSPRQPM